MPVIGECSAVECTCNANKNDDYECTAEQIAVGHAGPGATCLTYQPRLLPRSPSQPEHRQS